MTINFMIPTTPKLDKFFTVIVEGLTTISHHSGDRKSRHIKGAMQDATMGTLSKVTPSYLQHHKLSRMRQDMGLDAAREFYNRYLLKVNDFYDWMNHVCPLS